MSAKKPPVAFSCKQCGVEFYGAPSAAIAYAGVRRSQFCSKACHNVSMKRTDHDKFWEKVEMAGLVPTFRPELGLCWLWRGKCGEKGYGEFTCSDSGTRKAIRAHRFAWEEANGIPLQLGLQFDHLCRIRNCVRPTHVEPVTCRENILRGHAARRAGKAA